MYLKLGTCAECVCTCRRHHPFHENEKTGGSPKDVQRFLVPLLASLTLWKHPHVMNPGPSSIQPWPEWVLYTAFSLKKKVSANQMRDVDFNKLINTLLRTSDTSKNVFNPSRSSVLCRLIIDSPRIVEQFHSRWTRCEQVGPAERKTKPEQRMSLKWLRSISILGCWNVITYPNGTKDFKPSVILSGPQDKNGEDSI